MLLLLVFCCFFFAALLIWDCATHTHTHLLLARLFRLADLLPQLLHLRRTRVRLALQTRLLRLPLRRLGCPLAGRTLRLLLPERRQLQLVRLRQLPLACADLGLQAGLQACLHLRLETLTHTGLQLRLRHLRGGRGRRRRRRRGWRRRRRCRGCGRGGCGCGSRGGGGGGCLCLRRRGWGRGNSVAGLVFLVGVCDAGEAAFRRGRSRRRLLLRLLLRPRRRRCGRSFAGLLLLRPRLRRRRHRVGVRRRRVVREGAKRAADLAAVACGGVGHAAAGAVPAALPPLARCSTAAAAAATASGGGAGGGGGGGRGGGVGGRLHGGRRGGHADAALPAVSAQDVHLGGLVAFVDDAATPRGAGVRSEQHVVALVVLARALADGGVACALAPGLTVIGIDALDGVRLRCAVVRHDDTVAPRAVASPHLHQAARRELRLDRSRRGCCRLRPRRRRRRRRRVGRRGAGGLLSLVVARGSDGGPPRLARRAALRACRVESGAALAVPRLAPLLLLLLLLLRGGGSRLRRASRCRAGRRRRRRGACASLAGAVVVVGGRGEGRRRRVRVEPVVRSGRPALRARLRRGGGTALGGAGHVEGVAAGEAAEGQVDVLGQRAQPLPALRAREEEGGCVARRRASARRRRRRRRGAATLPVLLRLRLRRSRRRRRRLLRRRLLRGGRGVEGGLCVDLALLLAEHEVLLGLVEGGLEKLEGLLGIGCRVLVGVHKQAQLPVALFDLGKGAGAFYAQEGGKITLGVEDLRHEAGLFGGHGRVCAWSEVWGCEKRAGPLSHALRIS